MGSERSSERLRRALGALVGLACLGRKGPRVLAVPVGSGRPFGGDYARLVELVLGPAATP